MSGLKFYVVDTETSGLRASYHEITEIGIIRVTDRMQLHRCIRCEYPERASFDALKITKKTTADLSKGYDKAAVVAECNKFFAEDGATPAARVIVGHNIIAFDKKFLHALWAEQGQEFPAHLWLDTMSLTRQFLKQAGIKTRSINLHASCDYVGVKKLSEAHNAKIDSRNNYLLYKNLIEEKKIDYLPFIKSFPHTLSISNDNGGLDPDLLNL